MNIKLLVTTLLLIGLSVGCATYSLTKTSHNSPNILPPTPTVEDSKKDLKQIGDEMNEHFGSPILKLQKDSSAKPCKLTWQKSEGDEWKVAVIEKNDNTKE
tara:strand:+ start:5403 stop:5705 length:303 start_codon:yes stop_codon:yes gene_type:complete